MNVSEITTRAGLDQLEVLGAFHPGPQDAAPDGCETLVLLGPAAGPFWPAFQRSPEFSDGAPDPLDRWSRRVISAIATEFGALPLFPFGGPPWQPFQSWALRSGRAWQSPVRLLVHDTAGLMVSYRGALAFSERLDLPALPTEAPCLDCEKPCLAACPAAALNADGYDVPACHAFLDTEAGTPCMTAGCLVRRACPVSQSFGRDPDQSAFHMRSFHP